MNKPTELQSSDFGEILFQAAAAQMRADALCISAIAAAKKLAADQQYAATNAKMIASFKRMSEKRRASLTWEAECMDSKTQAEVDAEMLRDFDATEARAINGGAL